MRIKYSVSTMVYWWREHNLSFEQECEFLRSLGFGVELWPTMRANNDCRFVRRNWIRLKEATRGMSVSLHSRNDGPTIEEWKEQIECAKMLKAPIVVDLEALCISDKLDIADWDFAEEVVKTADDSGVNLCVETGALPMLLEVGSKFDTIRYCFDTGFINIDSKNSFTQYVDELAAKITYLHLNDNYGRLDDHEPPGLAGGISRQNWDYLFNGLSKYDNEIIATLEMFPAMPGALIKQGCEFLFDTLNWPNRPPRQPGYDETAYQPF